MEEIENEIGRRNSKQLRDAAEELAQDVAEEYLSTGGSPVDAIAEGIRGMGLTGRERTATRDAVAMRVHQIIAEQVSHGQTGVHRDRTGYKVVRSDADDPSRIAKIYRPATRHALQSIRYAWGETTEPTASGPVALFSDLESAKKWVHDAGRNDPHLHIYLVSYEPSTEEVLWKRLPPIFIRGQYHGYYPVSQGIKKKSLHACPDGTVLADWVELLADVTPHEATVA